VVHLALRVDVLAGTHHHCLGRGHVCQWRLSRVCVRNPYRDREAVCRAAEEDGYRAREMEEQRRRAVGECYAISQRQPSLSRPLGEAVAEGSRTVDIGARRQRRIL